MPIISYRTATRISYKALSKLVIEQHIIEYFSRRFRVRPGNRPILTTTDLKERFNFSDSSWAGIAEALSAQDWMKAIGVRLAVSDMKEATIVSDIADVILAKVGRK